MNKELLRKWLVEYKQELEDRIEEYESEDKENIQKMTQLSYKIQNDEIKSLEELQILFSELEISFFSAKYTNHWQKRYAFNVEPLEKYLHKFKHLLNKQLPIDIRINAALHESEYLIKDIDIESLTYLIWYNEPQKYIPHGAYTQGFIHALNLEKSIYQKQGTHTFGAFYKALHEVIYEEILDLFSDFLYKKSFLEVPNTECLSKISLIYELDRFISNVVYSENSAINYSFIDRFILTNFYSISEIELHDLKNKKLIFLLGENGVGKTVLLKGLLISLKNYFLQNKASQEDIGIISQILSENEKLFINTNIFQDTNEFLQRLQVPEQYFEEFYLKNCYAYGTQRSKISKTEQAEPYGFLSLFQSNQYMTNIESWLLSIERKELKGQQMIGVKGIERILGQVLDYPNLKIVIKEEGMGEVFFELNNKEYKLRQLSEGYQTIMILVVDLLARLTLNNSDVRDTKDFRAVVLIDELDLFLHPKWEKNICGKLHTIFPNIQFFVTTHSPILVDGAVKDKRIDNTKIKIFKLGLENGATVVEREYTGDLIENWTPNLLINSEMFDNSYLENLDEEQINELRSENNEAELLRTAKSFKIVSKREKELKERYLNDLKKSVL